MGAAERISACEPLGSGSPVHTERLLPETCYQFLRETADRDWHEGSDHFPKLCSFCCVFQSGIAHIPVGSVCHKLPVCPL